MNYRNSIGGNSYKKINVDKEHIYYNVRIDNQINGNSNAATTECVYDQQTQNILDKQSSYEMAIQSWNIRAKLPIFIATIKQGTNTDINAMPFSVNYRYTTGGITTNFQTELVWIPDDAFSAANPDRTVPLPRTPNENNGIQDIFTSPNYYYCNSYIKFVNLINNALLASFNAFNAAHPGIVAEQAWVQYDNRTGLFGIIGNLEYAIGLGGVGTNKPFVSFDALLYKYIDSIPANFNGYDQPNGADYTIAFEQKNGNSNLWAKGNRYAPGIPSVTQTIPPDYIIMEQESDCRSLWSNIKQIIITSNSMNVRSEFMPQIEFPQQLNQQNTIPNPNPNPLIGGTSIISDINSFNLDKKSIISYIDYNYASPNANIQSSTHRDIFYTPRYYKWIDLIGDSSLNNINIQMFFETEDGFVLPLQIPNKASVNVKMIFRRK
tara:strand:- start:29 stop:1333 length:1305 start_codon:yes stop_codon:yes gene_type:complete